MFISQDFHPFFFFFFDQGFCSNPENNPVRAIHKCNLGLCEHFCRGVTVSWSGPRVTPGHFHILFLLSFYAQILAPNFLLNPAGVLPRRLPNPSFVCAVRLGGIVRVVDVFGLKKEKKKKKLHLVKATDQYANHY